MKVGTIDRDGACLIPTVWRADHPWTRLRGLLGHRPLRGDAREALLLVRCNSVHTLGMRYALDIVFLDAGERVLGWHCALRPWRVQALWRAQQTLELAAGSLDRLHPSRGERWAWHVSTDPAHPPVPLGFGRNPTLNPHVHENVDAGSALSTERWLHFPFALSVAKRSRRVNGDVDERFEGHTMTRHSRVGGNRASFACRFDAGGNGESGVGNGIGNASGNGLALPQTASSFAGELAH